MHKRLAIATLPLFLAGCGGGGDQGLPGLGGLSALEPLVSEEDPDAERLVAFGRRLFHEDRLSLDGERSCASCHIPWKAYGGRSIRRVGGGRVDTPALLGVGRRSVFGWRAQWSSLTSAVAHPFGEVDGFGGSNVAVKRAFAQDESLRDDFEQALGRAPSTDDRELLDGVVEALLAFVQQLDDVGTPFDLATADPVGAPLASDAIRGWGVFRDEGCVDCHPAPAFTDESLRWHGIPLDEEERESFEEGDPLGELVERDDDRRPDEYRTPSLRNVTRTAPYGHDGRFTTLDDVFDYYVQGASTHRAETGLSEVTLSPTKRADLRAFLSALETPPLGPSKTGETVFVPSGESNVEGRPREAAARRDDEASIRPAQAPTAERTRARQRRMRRGGEGAEPSPEKPEPNDGER